MDEHVCVYVRGRWPFPWDSGLLYLSSFHPLAIWSFLMSWFDWIGAHLLSFLSIFFIFYLIHLVFIILCSYTSTSYVWYFLHHYYYTSYCNSIFFFILSLLIYSYCFFLPHWYIHIGRLSIHGLWDFLHILHFVHEGMGLIIGYLSLVFFRFFTLLP